MDPLDLGTVDGTRYIADAKRALVQFLRYYLQADHAALFARWASTEYPSGVRVSASYPEVKPEEHLPAPCVTVQLQSDEVDPTWSNVGENQYEAEWHKVTFEVKLTTDAQTGGRLVCDDLAAVVQKCCVEHRDDLEGAGFTILSRQGALQDQEDDLGLYTNSVQVTGDLLVLGRIARTVEVALATWTFKATGEGTYTDGAELTAPHVLRLKLLVGTSSNNSAVTVHAKNQSGVATTLTAAIPRTRSAGTYIALTPATPGDQFTDVTSITVSPSSGLPGEAFQIVNIPEEVE